MPTYLIGVDGGGTGCRAAIATLQGQVLGEGQAGPANIFSDPQNAVANIIMAAQNACAAAGLDHSALARSHALLGLAGYDAGMDTSRITRALPFARIVFETDGRIALEGALGTQDGAVAILGTGSLYIRRKDNIITCLGGWGFKIGDHGSGARLGQMALEQSLLAFDGIIPPSPFTRDIMAQFGHDPRAITEFSRHAMPADYARHAPHLFEAANQGDPIATKIIRNCAQDIDLALDVVVKNGHHHICLLGGLADIYRPWLALRHQPFFMPPLSGALMGAVGLAQKQFGL